MVLQLVSSLLTVAADAGDAAEDPGSNAHSERHLLTQDSSHTLFNWDLKIARETLLCKNTDIPTYPPNHSSTSSAARYTRIRDLRGGGKMF